MKDLQISSISRIRSSTLNSCIAGRSSRQYKIDNADHVHQKNLEYIEKHKEKINFKHECGCGGKFMERHQLAHARTMEHKQYLQDNEPQ